MSKDIYIIQDANGRITGTGLVFKTDVDEIVYITYSGISDGFTYYQNKEIAEESLEKINSFLHNYGISKHLKVVSIKKDDIPRGESHKEFIKLKGFCIKDENDMFVYKNSIKKCGLEFYYLPTERLDRWYVSRDRIEKALSCLELHNQEGNLNHKFKIIKL